MDSDRNSLLMMTIIILILIIITSRLTSLYFFFFFLIKSLALASAAAYTKLCARQNISPSYHRTWCKKKESSLNGDVDMSLYFVPHIYKRLQQPPLNVIIIIISLTHSDNTNEKFFFFHINIFALFELIRESHIRWLPYLFKKFCITNQLHYISHKRIRSQ
jgi:hypothetical protein